MVAIALPTVSGHSGMESFSYCLSNRDFDLDTVRGMRLSVPALASRARCESSRHFSLSIRRLRRLGEAIILTGKLTRAISVLWLPTAVTLRSC